MAGFLARGSGASNVLPSLSTSGLSLAAYHSQLREQLRILTEFPIKPG